MPERSAKDIWASDNDHNGYKDGGSAGAPPGAGDLLRRRARLRRSSTTHLEEVNCNKKREDSPTPRRPQYLATDI